MPRKLKVAHFAIATPRKSGLYETTHELVSAERALDLDARIVDPKPHPQHSVAGDDRGVPISDFNWAVGADVVCSHSGHEGTPIDRTSQPIVVMAHGRPESTWLMERDGGPAGFGYHVSRPKSDRFKACVTFWESFEAFFRPLWAPKPVVSVPPCVDLAYWSPGPSGYDFGGNRGSVNVVMADPWERRDYRLIPCLAAFHLFRQMTPGAKLHLYAVSVSSAIRSLKMWLGDGLGVVQGWASDLRPVYRAADLVITSHKIATRSVREAMACGTPVVSAADVDVDDYETFALEMVRRLEHPGNPRAMAVARFNPKDTASSVCELLERVACERTSA